MHARSWLIAPAVAISLILVAIAAAQQASVAGDRCCCLCGKKVCVLEVSESDEEVTRFDVKTRDVCIPSIRFPWDLCGPRRGGGVRTVCVLEEVKQERKVCKYDWSIKTICTQCCKRHALQHDPQSRVVQRDPRVPFEYYTADLPAEPRQALLGNDHDTHELHENSGARAIDER